MACHALHCYLLKTRTSWNLDRSWNKTSSTSSDAASPGHSVPSSLNQPFFSTSIVIWVDLFTDFCPLKTSKTRLLKENWHKSRYGGLWCQSCTISQAGSTPHDVESFTHVYGGDVDELIRDAWMNLHCSHSVESTLLKRDLISSSTSI